jgi:hypothetical protein
MATYPTGWLRLPTDAKDFKERFAWSHVKAIFYDKAKNILLKDKLDAMDKLISDHADAIVNKLMTNDAFNTAIADYVTKAMMSSTQVNDANHVPTSSLAYAMQQAITANANAITQLNSEIGYIQNYDIDTLSSPSQLTHSGYYQFVNCSSTVNDNASTKFTDYQIGDFVGLLITRNGYATSDAGCQWGTFIITSPRFTNKFWIGRIWGYKFVNFIKIGS